MSARPAPARFLVVGAGSRGTAYAKAIQSATAGVVAAVAEPDAYKRRRFGERFIWGSGGAASAGQAFADWREFVVFEQSRQDALAAVETENDRAGGDAESRPGVLGVDAVFVCVLDEMHRDVVVGLRPLGLHVMCEKPLATTLRDCIDMYRALRAPPGSGQRQQRVFAIGHVLRYSPHNVLLRRLLREDKAIGDVLSAVHTEPVGWWHFAHSYVRGNWRREDCSAPALLTKSCHDIDLLLWLLCSPVRAGAGRAHEPSAVSSVGGVQQFRRARKPAEAGAATNCTRCAIGDDGCIFSAKRVYLGPELQGVGTGNTGWPVKIVVPDIEAYPTLETRRAAVLAELERDYTPDTPDAVVRAQNWFGRCVFDGDNDVCDEQVVTMQWEDDQDTGSGADDADRGARLAKTATFHMVAQTQQICQRYSRFYGTRGELTADSRTICVTDFRTGEVTRFDAAAAADTGHGGGDVGLAAQFVAAVEAVKSGAMVAEEAQARFVGCTLEEVLRSHAMVFAAEEARRGKKVVEWKRWWETEVEAALRE
ncbi:uncharacterized protein BROUX77_002489 [Berkeleyomyces rouxiae]|uniref:uncharacterized protein n=1 Tax=Berkeleyomyces rouxiae TaxID=2035830 RepID=UPI003B766D13